MGAKDARPSEAGSLLRGNHFHPCEHAPKDVLQAGRDLKVLLSLAGDAGMRERELLAWFGASTARMALLALAAGRPPPLFVAREFIISDMRTDFALLEVPQSPNIAPHLLLVECQGALPGTLFRAGKRTLLHWGADFLEGFGQLMDWHFVGYHEVLSQKIATLAAGHLKPLQTTFMLVAGLQRFSRDPLSKLRLDWWANTVSLGSNFKIARFDDVADQAIYWIEACGQWHVELAPSAPMVAEPRAIYRPLLRSTSPNNKAALAGRPHAVSMAGAGAGA